jgi:hypothetical protein
MNERLPDKNLERRLRDAWSAEVAQARVDYATGPGRVRTHIQFAMPLGLVALVVGAVVVAGALRPAFNAVSPTRVVFGDLAGSAVPDKSHATALSDVTISDDRRSVTVMFGNGVGACKYPHQGEAEIVGDELRIGLYAQGAPDPSRTPAPLPSDLSGVVACFSIYVVDKLVINLPTAFDGERVRDVSNNAIFLLAPPADLAQITALPDGWDLESQRTVRHVDTPQWERHWVKSAEKGNGVTLLQNFGGPIEDQGYGTKTANGEPVILHSEPVSINGQPGSLYVDPYLGHLVLLWSLGPDGLKLDADMTDFSREQFIALANSVVVPSP